LDGTLIDSVSSNHPMCFMLLKDAFKHIGVPSPSIEVIKKAMEEGGGMRSIINKVLGRTEESYSFKIEKFIYENYEDYLLKYARLIPGARDVLRSCIDNGYKLAIITNLPTPLVNIVLKTFDLRRYFSVIVCVKHGLRPKPSPDLIRKTVEELYISPQQLLVIGDSPCDIKAASQTRAIPIGVLTGIGTRLQLYKLGAMMIIPSIAYLNEIIEFLGKLRPSEVKNRNLIENLIK